MRPRRAMAEINVVPYIDVMLVLLVIFMATAPVLMQGVEVDLPDANSSPVSDSDAEPLIVSIDAQARLYLNLGASDDLALNIETVKQRVATVLKRNPEKAVIYAQRMDYSSEQMMDYLIDDFFEIGQVIT
mgnify:CR=1 FL=1